MRQVVAAVWPMFDPDGSESIDRAEFLDRDDDLAAPAPKSSGKAPASKSAGKAPAAAAAPAPSADERRAQLRAAARTTSSVPAKRLRGVKRICEAKAHRPQLRLPL